MAGATKDALRAIMREMEPNVFNAEYRGETNQDEAGVEAFPDSHFGTDAANVKLWVETMARDPGYDRVAGTAVLAGVLFGQILVFGEFAGRCNMQSASDLLPGRLLRHAGPPKPVPGFRGIQIDDDRLSKVLSADAPLMMLHEGTIHAEGPAWQSTQDRLVWSDVPNRRLLGWYPDGHVEVLIDGTWFMNGNAVEADGTLVHCEHGRRCISRGGDYDRQPEPIVTHYQGKRINSPNDIAVAPDGTIWFTDPTFGIIMPNQGALAPPEVDHRSVYRFDPRTGDLRRMADFEEPNGLAFTADGKALYVSDTSLSLGEVPEHMAGTKHEIIAFDVGDGGTLSNRRFFCHTDHGYPDGFALDARGWVWTSAADGIHIWSADRHKLGFVPTPAVVSNCTLGGTDGRRLFIAATQYLLAIDLIG